MARASHFLSPEQAILRLVPRREPLILAVSGGADSMALLHGVVGGNQTHTSMVTVVHVDHRLRPESGSEADFVAQVCRQLAVPCIRRCAPDPIPTVNIEAWARRVRYRILEEERARLGASWILTAHHADDLVETYLIQLLQNRELVGIGERLKRRALLRPFLCCRRRDLVSYLQERELRWIEDPSNSSPRFMRNRIRHELLPLLGALVGEGALEQSVIEQCRSHIADRHALVLSAKRFVAPWMDAIGKAEGILVPSLKVGEIRVAFIEQPSAIAWRAARMLVQHVVGVRLGERKSHEVVALMRGEVKAINLPKGKILRLTKERGIVWD